MYVDHIRRSQLHRKRGRSVWTLTGLYLLTNGMLLVPTREDGAISALLLGAGMLVGGLLPMLRRQDPTLATPEGVFARTVLFMPLLILGGRSLWLYAPDALFFTTLSLIAYLALRLTLTALGAATRWRGALEALTLLIAGLSAVLAFASLIDARAIPESAKLPLTVAVFAGLLIDLSTTGTPRRVQYHGAAAMLLSAAMLLNFVVFGGFGNALAGLVVGIAVLLHGYVAKSRLVFALGLITVLAGLGLAARTVLETFSIGGWSALVVLGIATILAGSVMERRGAEIKAHLMRWHGRFNDVT